jgi:peptidoglycan hydrolase-like protein with peptidoglycan-binding domain
MGDGDYGGITKTAVKQFQEKYAREILTPHGLKYGSGNAANAANAKINALMVK